NGDTISLDSFAQPSNGTLVDNGDGTLTYTPAVAGYDGTDSFTYTVTDGDLTDTATVTLTVGNPPQGTLFSDDFSSGTLDPVWNIQGPAGISHSLDSDASD
ncbi:MAG: cadherin-like domain-containing protein, partial [Pseudomonadota bacterium]